MRAIQKKGVLDICRAKMELAIGLGDEGAVERGEIVGRLEKEAGAVIVNNDDSEGSTPVVTRIKFLIDPSQYRRVDAIAKEGGGTLKIFRHAVTQEGGANVGSELERNTLHQT